MLRLNPVKFCRIACLLLAAVLMPGCENDEKEDTSLHLLRGLRIILSIILFIILACVIWIVPITSWWLRLIVAIIAVAIIVLFH